MGVEKGADDSLRPEQKEILDGLVRRFFVDGERCLLVEAPTGVGKTRIALEFVREFWRRRGRCRVLVVVPRRALAYNSWRKKMEACVIINRLARLFQPSASSLHCRQVR
jgi:superfamily II DNA or RNA helicase